MKPFASPKAKEFLVALRARFKFCSYDAAAVLGIKSDLVRYYLAGASKPTEDSIGISGVKYAWSYYLRTGHLPDACMVFSAKEEHVVGRPSAATTAMYWWLDDVIGWKNLTYIANKLGCKRSRVKHLIKLIDSRNEDKLWPRVYRYSCRSVARLIAQETQKHIPRDYLVSLCRNGLLRWHREGRAMIIKPNDAEWMIENWQPGLKVPKHPGGNRWG